jgi:hypothetical protein
MSWDNDEFKVISRTRVVIDCIVIINNAMDYNGAQLNIQISKMCKTAILPVTLYRCEGKYLH